MLQTAVLQEHLRSHGAEIIDDFADLSRTSEPGLRGDCHLVIPHTMSALDTTLNLEEKDQLTVVTDMWVERCLYQKRFEEPRAHVMSTPLARFPIAGT